MKIRLAVIEDLTSVRKYDSHISVKRLEECLHSGKVYVLCQGEVIMGVLRYNLFWQTIPFMDLIYLDEEIRGKGWGREIVAEWEAAMKQQGYDHVLLSTQADETAKYFYEKLGYQHAGGFYPPEQDAEELIYRKELIR